MFWHRDIKGSDLPPRTLCLTFDDGPGEQTAELARFLQVEGIEATFFVVGEHARQRFGVLNELHRCGQAIGNHTYTHPGLVSVAEAGGDVVGELARVDEMVRPYCDGRPLFFRAPYGNWRQIDSATGEDCEHSIVAEMLNRSDRFQNYIGPVNWDISAEDFAFWRRGESAETVCAAYLDEIEAVGRGIVLLHDSSDEEVVRRQNRALELTKLLVLELRRRGYSFVALRELPQVQRCYYHEPEERNHGTAMCIAGHQPQPA